MPDRISVNPLSPAGSLDRWLTYLPDHPLVPALSKPAFQGHYVLSDLISRALWCRKGVYNEVYRANEVEDEWVIVAGEPPVISVNVILRKKRGFSDKDRQKLGLLVPHLRAAYKNARYFNSAIPFALAAQAHAELAEGMILLDEQKQVLHCSETTSRLLGSFFQGTSESRQLTRLPAELEARLNDPSPNILKKVLGHQTLEIRIYCDKASGRYLLTTHLLDSGAVISRLEVLGLSPREAEVLYWIGEGKRNEEIATILNLSIHTVKTHLKSVFRRLGVETRTAAAALAFSRK